MPAIVIPSRTKRWFHDWKPAIQLNAGSAAPFPQAGDTYQFPSELYGGGGSFTIRGDAGYYMGLKRDLTGIPEAYGTCDEFPRTGSGQYLSISREGYEKAFGKALQFPIKMPKPFWT